MHQAESMGRDEADSNGASHRLFFALWPDVLLRKRVAATVAQLDRENMPGGRRLNPDRYHLTLQFLGDFQPLRPPVLDAAILAAEGLHPRAFDLSLDLVGSFSGARVGWLGASAPPEALQQLWDDLGSALARARLPIRSPAVFTPHLTVLRNVRRPLPPMPITPLHWSVHEFVLIDSVSGAQPAYRLLGRWPLQRS